LISIVFRNLFPKIFSGISYNVPTLSDVLAARIRALRSKEQGCKTVGGVWRGDGAKRNDRASRNPFAAYRRQSANSPVMRSAGVLHYFIFMFFLMNI
jgi:hypothetical protein